MLPSAIRAIEVATKPKASHASRAIALLEERLVLGASRLHTANAAATVTSPMRTRRIRFLLALRVAQRQAASRLAVAAFPFARMMPGCKCSTEG